MCLCACMQILQRKGFSFDHLQTEASFGIFWHKVTKKAPCHKQTNKQATNKQKKKKKRKSLHTCCFFLSPSQTKPAFLPVLNFNITAQNFYCFISIKERQTNKHVLPPPPFAHTFLYFCSFSITNTHTFFSSFFHYEHTHTHTHTNTHTPIHIPTHTCSTGAYG